MSERDLVARALVAVAVIAAVAFLLCAQPWRPQSRVSVTLGWVLGLALGVYAGCWLLSLWPHWPPRDCADRLLILVLPAALIVELLASLPATPGWLGIALRLIVVAGAAPVLLYGSQYVAGTQAWSPGLMWLVLGGLAAALALQWLLVALLVRRAPGMAMPAMLAGVCGGAGVTIMLSSYATGGQLGLPLAAALGGAALATLTSAGLRGSVSWVGPTVAGLFSLLVIGHFFGQLKTTHAAILFAAPLLAWLLEAPYVRRLHPWAKEAGRIVLTAAVVAAVAFHAYRLFQEDSQGTPGSNEPTLQDYMDLR